MATHSMMKFVGLIILSIVVSFVADFIDAWMRGSLFNGESGFPFRSAETSFFGGGTIEYSMVFLNLFFWFITIWGLFFLTKKFLKRH